MFLSKILFFLTVSLGNKCSCSDFFIYSCRNKTRENQQDDDCPYIKRPPNAFMLYIKEQKPNVVAEWTIKGSAAVNSILGKRVSVLCMFETLNVTQTSSQFVKR